MYSAMDRPYHHIVRTLRAPEAALELHTAEIAIALLARGVGAAALLRASHRPSTSLSIDVYIIDDDEQGLKRLTCV